MGLIGGFTQPDPSSRYGRQIVERDNKYHRRRLAAIKKQSNLDNEVSHICKGYRKFRKKQPFWKPVGWTKQVIDANRKAHNELLCRTTSHINDRLSSPVEHIRARMRTKSSSPSLVTTKEIEYQQRRLQERIVGAQPDVESHMSQELQKEMRLYQENRRPNFQPSPLEAQMAARDAAIHQDMLDRAKSGLHTKCSTAARKFRHHRRRNPKWMLPPEAVLRNEADMERHNSIIKHTRPRVDSTTPHEAMHHMQVRHRYPDLGTGSFVERAAIEQHLQFHHRMVHKARATVDCAVPVTLAQIIRAPPARLERLPQHTAMLGSELAADGLVEVEVEGEDAAEGEMMPAPLPADRPESVATPLLPLRQPWDVHSRPTTQELDPHWQGTERPRDRMCTPAVARFPLFAAASDKAAEAASDGDGTGQQQAAASKAEGQDDGAEPVIRVSRHLELQNGEVAADSDHDD